MLSQRLESFFSNIRFSFLFCHRFDECFTLAVPPPATGVPTLSSLYLQVVVKDRGVMGTQGVFIGEAFLPLNEIARSPQGEEISQVGIFGHVNKFRGFLYMM